MALYVVLRHRLAAEQTYHNVWLDESRIQVIETPIEVGQLCGEAGAKGERIFVHRCGWQEFEPVICCSVLVEKMSDTFDDNVFVTFKDPVVMDEKPKRHPARGENYYFA